MAAVLELAIFLVMMTLADMREAKKDKIPLTGDHVCERMVCVVVEKNESYVGCSGCLRDQVPPIHSNLSNCDDLLSTDTTLTPSDIACPTDQRHTCHRSVTRYEKRSTNTKFCCDGYVEKEEGKCASHTLLHHIACQLLGTHMSDFAPRARCGMHALCVDSTCVCERGYEADSEGHHCVDIDECDSLHTPCDHYCTNIDGGYYCECTNLDELRSNGHNCTRKIAGETTTASTNIASNEDSNEISATHQTVSMSKSLTAGFVAAGAFVVIVVVGALLYSRRRSVNCPPTCGRTTEGDNAMIIRPHQENLAFENQLYGELPPPPSAT